MGKEKPVQLFRQQFQRAWEVMSRAPGRVNLIGEHTDYNDGFVLPAAIDRTITVVAAKREDSLIRAHSVEFAQGSSFRLDQIEPDAEAPWSNYLRGVLAQYRNKGFELPGADLLISGNVPIEAGLSSSAALEVAVAETFRVLGSLDIDPSEMALLCQAAERDFVGVQCGIMDQFISTLARERTALFLDCRDLSHALVPWNLEASIVICDSRVQRSLDASQYNQRGIECEEAARRLNGELGNIRALRDVEMSQLQKAESILPDRLFRRVRHVMTENQRVLSAVNALEKNDGQKLGKLLIHSHNSLRDDYEVSCQELDLLVELACQEEGTLGARMTGAGFGGCTVNLVRPGRVKEFCENVERKYQQHTGLNPHIQVCSLSHGVTSHLNTAMPPPSA